MLDDEMMITRLIIFCLLVRSLTQTLNLTFVLSTTATTTTTSSSSSGGSSSSTSKIRYKSENDVPAVVVDEAELQL